MFTRRVVVWGLALGAVLWGMYTAQNGLLTYRRRELTRRLVRALDDYQWKPVASLIRQGADPLTRGSDGMTAMFRAASLGDLTTLCTILKRAHADPDFVSRELPELPSRKVDTSGGLSETEDSLARLVEQPGAERLLNAWLGLGLVRQRLGRYAGAASAYREARRLAPTSRIAKDGLAAAEHAAAIAARIAPALPAGARILTLTPAAPAGVWAVVFYKPGDPQTGNDYAWVRAGFYRDRGQWMAPLTPPIPLRDPRFGDAYRDVRLFTHDVTGDGKPELAIELLSMGGSWEPTYLLVLELHHERFKQLLGLPSSEPLWLEDLNGDGKYEAGNSYEIGDHMSHAEQPLWGDLYAFDGDRYRQANRRFPQEFREWPRTLSDLLLAYPTDPAILDYLGRTYEIIGLPTEALRCYRQASHTLLPDLAEAADTPVYQAELRKRHAAMRKRMAVLEAASIRSGKTASRR